MNRHNLRKALCVVLVASLLEPSFCPAQQPTTPAPSTAPLAPGRPVTAPTTSGPAGGRIMPGPDYRLGPGDTLEVQIAGRLDIDRFQVVVDPTGAISVPPLGSIQVGGLGLLEAHRRVVQRASTVFRFADVTLSVSAPRTLEVTLSGEVERPGTLTVSALRRLHEVILDAGGVTPRGGGRAQGVVHRCPSARAEAARGYFTRARRRAVRPAALRAPGYRRGAWRFRRHAGVEQDDRRRQDDDRAALRAGAGRPRARLRVPRGRRCRVRRPPASRGRARRGDGATAADPDRPAAADRREGRDAEHPAPERRRPHAACRRGQGVCRRRGEEPGRRRIPARVYAP